MDFWPSWSIHIDLLADRKLHVFVHAYAIEMSFRLCKMMSGVFAMSCAYRQVKSGQTKQIKETKLSNQTWNICLHIRAAAPAADPGKGGRGRMSVLIFKQVGEVSDI